MDDEFTPVTDEAESRRLFKLLKDHWIGHLILNPDSYARSRLVGHQGGGHDCQVYWNADIGIWGVFETTITSNRFWICWGNTNPDLPDTEENPFNIIVETNPPFGCINRRVAGTFVRNNKEQFFLAHKGKFGGNLMSLSVAAFRKFAQDRFDQDEFAPNLNWGTIRWSERETTQNIILGEIGTNSLLSGIKVFVGKVSEFKRQVAHGRIQ